MNERALMGSLDSSVYNQEEFKKAKTPERIRMYLVAGAELSAYKLRSNEREYLKYMELAWSLSQENRNQREAVRLLRTQTDLSRFRATQIMRDACNLFGSYEDVHRPTQRAMIRENLLLCIDQCEKEIKPQYDEESETYYTPGTSDERMAWMKVLQGYWKLLMELDQVTTIEEAIQRDTKLPEIKFTTDVAALMEAEAEDIEYDDA